jgi:hypothetical protein
MIVVGRLLGDFKLQGPAVREKEKRIQKFAWYSPSLLSFRAYGLLPSVHLE